MKSFTIGASLIAGALLYSGCELQTLNSSSNDDILYGTTEVAGNPNFSAARAVIKSKCVSCHRTFGTYTEEEWVSFSYIVAGAPASSYLFSRMKGSGVGGSEDMPPTGTLSSGDLATVRTWIEELQ